MELDHMIPKSEAGPDTIENAIPVCFECHAEIHAYNDKHPRGRKFRPSELKLHKKQWLKVCRENPRALAEMPADASVGPLQAVLDEIDFNLIVIETTGSEPTYPFIDEQFRRALQLGAFCVLPSDVKRAVNIGYAGIGRANHIMTTATHQHSMRDGYAHSISILQRDVPHLKEELQRAKERLTAFLAPER